MRSSGFACAAGAHHSASTPAAIAIARFTVRRYPGRRAYGVNLTVMTSPSAIT
jgi:hypothetical protein